MRVGRFYFQINKDLEGSVSFLAQTGRFSVPLKCSTKKCSVSAAASLPAFSGRLWPGQRAGRCVPAVGSGRGDEHGVLREAAGKRTSRGRPRLQGLRSGEPGLVREALAGSAVSPRFFLTVVAGPCISSLEPISLTAGVCALRPSTRFQTPTRLRQSPSAPQICESPFLSVPRKTRSYSKCCLSVCLSLTSLSSMPRRSVHLAHGRISSFSMAE